MFQASKYLKMGTTLSQGIKKIKKPNFWYRMCGFENKNTNVLKLMI